MPDPEPDTVQLQFDKGSLVNRSSEDETTSDEYTAEPITPGDRTGFTVEVKDNAIEVNTTISEIITTHGRTLDFGSRAHAGAYASQLSAGDGSLRIQAAPANDPRDVDAYLLADHTPSITKPAATDGETWTFDVGANLYGALGEAILTSAPKPHALYYFVRQDLEVDDRELESGQPWRSRVGGRSRLTIQTAKNGGHPTVSFGQRMGGMAVCWRGTTVRSRPVMRRSSGLRVW
ncbi:hypothetical protein ACFFQF_20710 [Haladaptatus pallidirubidus]|uniref:hypothetical protein n=1 Tax=Haladaptatus pallidirubidus TaxID=1008152 RepID=UPI0035EF58CB